MGFITFCSILELYGRNSDFILALYSILKLIFAGIISFGSYPTMCQGISQDRQPSRRIIWNSLMGLPGVEFIPAHPRTQRVAYLRKILFLQSVKFTSCRSEFDPGRRDWPRGCCQIGLKQHQITVITTVSRRNSGSFAAWNVRRLVIQSGVLSNAYL